MQHAALHLRSPALLPPPSSCPNECRLIVIKIGFLLAPDCATGRTSGQRRVLPKRFAAWKTVSLRFVYVCDISRFSFSVCGHFACLRPRNCTPPQYAPPGYVTPSPTVDSRPAADLQPFRNLQFVSF